MGINTYSDPKTIYITHSGVSTMPMKVCGYENVLVGFQVPEAMKDFFGQDSLSKILYATIEHLENLTKLACGIVSQPCKSKIESLKEHLNDAIEEFIEDYCDGD